MTTKPTTPQERAEAYAEIESQKQVKIVRSNEYALGRSREQKILDGVQVGIFTLDAARNGFIAGEKSGVEHFIKNTLPQLIDMAREGRVVLQLTDEWDFYPQYAMEDLLEKARELSKENLK